MIYIQKSWKKHSSTLIILTASVRTYALFLTAKTLHLHCNWALQCLFKSPLGWFGQARPESLQKHFRQTVSRRSSKAQLKAAWIELSPLCNGLTAASSLTALIASSSFPSPGLSKTGIIQFYVLLTLDHCLIHLTCCVLHHWLWWCCDGCGLLLNGFKQHFKGPKMLYCFLFTY